MRHGSLFSGIGGFDLAAEWMGWENIFHCEWNETAKNTLKYYWPNAISYGDITKTDFSIHRGGIDIITGGFPCQPYSVSGKRKGKEDERHLWPEMLRAIREIQPRYVVGENVRGIINWGGGVVFDEVQTQLETQGYEILPFLLPVAGKNAIHQRERVWFVAFNPNENECGQKKCMESNRSDSNDEEKEVFFTEEHLIEGFNNLSIPDRSCSQKFISRIDFETNDGWPTESPFLIADDGISSRLDFEGIFTLEAVGNAIAPQVAFEIFKAIQQYENQNGRKQ